MAVGVDIGGTFTDLALGHVAPEDTARDCGYGNWTTSRRSGSAG